MPRVWRDASSRHAQGRCELAVVAGFRCSLRRLMFTTDGAHEIARSASWKPPKVPPSLCGPATPGGADTVAPRLSGQSLLPIVERSAMEREIKLLPTLGFVILGGDDPHLAEARARSMRTRR